MKALLVDIGNTRIKWRVSGQSDGNPLLVTDAERLATLWDGALRTVDVVLVSNVAGDAIGARVVDAVRAARPALSVEQLRPQAVECGVENGYDDPARLGSDRWAALIGAHAGAPGRHLLVCSFGTATTIDLLLALPDGSTSRFVGGLILPGLDAMRRALHRSTAGLPLAAGRAVDFAVDTDDAIESGIVAAQLGAVARAANRARKRMATGDSRGLDLLFAGGWAEALAPLVADDLGAQPSVAPNLVLNGLEAIVNDRPGAYDAGR